METTVFQFAKKRELLFFSVPPYKKLLSTNPPYPEGKATVCVQSLICCALTKYVQSAFLFLISTKALMLG